MILAGMHADDVDIHALPVHFAKPRVKRFRVQRHGTGGHGGQRHHEMPMSYRLAFPIDTYAPGVARFDARENW